MSTVAHVEPTTKSRARIVLGMLWRDKFACFAVAFLIVVVLCAVFGPALLGEAATDQNLRGRNAPPFSLDKVPSPLITSRVSLGATRSGSPPAPSSAFPSMSTIVPSGPSVNRPARV